MDRRDVLLGSVASLGLVLSQAAHAGKKDTPAAPPPAPPLSPKESLLPELARCEAEGMECEAHCAIELGKGNTSMAECAASVRQMLSLVRASRETVLHDAPLAKSLVAVCQSACDACAEACKKHEEHFGHGMHLECKACMEACLDCSKACAAYAA